MIPIRKRWPVTAYCSPVRLRQPPCQSRSGSGSWMAARSAALPRSTWAGLAQLSKTALLMVWDNASWHISKEVRHWIKAHNREVRQTGQGVRIVACYLPIKSPWLNPIEPHWVHGKRHIVEPARLLTAQELAGRVCRDFGCQHEAHLALTDHQD